MKARDLSGLVFGRLTIVRRVGSRRGLALWLCQCLCGREHAVVSGHLQDGSIRSCGCLRLETLHAAQWKHGHAKHGQRHPLYRIWVGIRTRCNNPRSRAYPYYSGRGVTLCERWNSFERFIADMGPRPSTRHSIDRIDNDGNYEPANCRWATAREQARNRRRPQLAQAEAQGSLLP